MPKTKASLLLLAVTAATVLTLFLLPFTPRVAVRTVPVERGELVKTTLMEGVVRYRDQQPCLALQSGRVSAVYARQGQRVKAGELLFCMDSAGEEEALAALSQTLYEQERALETFGDNRALVAQTLANGWEARQTRAELLASIEMKKIRAQKDGVVDGVYAREGDYVAEAAVLGTVRGEEKRVDAALFSGVGTQAVIGAAAEVRTLSGDRLGLATLSEADAPTKDEQTAQLIQRLAFAPAGENWLDGRKTGERVTVEMLLETQKNMALVPLSAVADGDRLWVVENGQATPVSIDTSQRNDQYVCVPERLLGKRVVLLAGECGLYPGCPVKEAKKR